MITDIKKALGAYYTPNLVTKILSSWAIRSTTDVLLEPSFGGCNFLISGIEQMGMLGSEDPVSQVYGFDIDPTAFTILENLRLSGHRFVKKDFLKTNPDDIPQKVSVVLGNPPYLPIQSLEESYRNEVIRKVSFRDFEVDRRSSLWVYFIIHSLNYLQVGGRMAWIVPDSISFTGYGKMFLANLTNYFATVRLLRIKERFFFESGTHEKTSILLCEEFYQPGSTLEVYEYDTLKSALSQVKSQSYKKEDKAPVVISFDETKFESSILGDVFDIRIGIVIGASKKLTLNNTAALKSPYYPEYIYPLVTKGWQLQNISVNSKDLTSLRHSPVYIIDGMKLERENKELYSLLCASLPDEIKTNATFKKRPHLFGYDDFKYPNAFLTFFAQKLPRLVENENQELNSTNSLHRLYYKQAYAGRKDVLRFIALQLYCNFLGDQTEALAREYGNSILKYEPSDAGKIPLIIPKVYCKELEEEINDCFLKVKHLISLAQLEDAKNEAFTFLKKTIIPGEIARYSMH